MCTFSWLFFDNFSEKKILKKEVILLLFVSSDYLSSVPGTLEICFELVITDAKGHQCNW